MEEIDLTSWDDFPSAIREVYNNHETHEFGQWLIPNDILFRGQADSSWKLRTTLERFSVDALPVWKYADVVHRCGPVVQSHTGRSWDLLTGDQIAQWFGNWEPITGQIPEYSFWIYLRQCGFPSPLLDWSGSPFVAAYFAASERCDADRFAVYAYVETPEGGKGGYVGATSISVQGPNVRAHPRHFIQQSWYTICTKLVENEYVFACHDEVFSTGSANQDLLIKITLPATERMKALKELRRMNITSFSLFQTEEALMRTLAFERLEML